MRGLCRDTDAHNSVSFGNKALDQKTAGELCQMDTGHKLQNNHRPFPKGLISFTYISHINKQIPVRKSGALLACFIHGDASAIQEMRNPALGSLRPERTD